MHFTVEAQRRVETCLFPGAIAIDATAGNGFDTQFLAERVGPTGTVFAIDLQPCSIERVRTRLENTGLSARVVLATEDHTNLKQIVAPKYWGDVACAMFNLGYLPLADKSVTTRTETTLAAIAAAAPILRPGGMLSVIAYVGHPGGREEAQAVAEWMQGEQSRFVIAALRDDSNPDSPILWSAQKR